MIDAKTDYEVRRDKFYNEFTPADTPATIEIAWQLKEISDQLKRITGKLND